MLHFATTSMDMMLWQIRVHTHLLGAEKYEKTLLRYRGKFSSEVEPQLKGRMEEHDYICEDQFSAVDCIMGPNYQLVPLWIDVELRFLLDQF